MTQPQPYTDGAQLAALHRSLTNVTPSPEKIQRIESLRGAAKDLATTMIDLVPSSPERTLASRKLEELVMWAVKAIVLGDDA